MPFAPARRMCWKHYKYENIPLGKGDILWVKLMRSEIRCSSIYFASGKM